MQKVQLGVTHQGLPLFSADDDDESNFVHGIEYERVNSVLHHSTPCFCIIKKYTTAALKPADAINGMQIKKSTVTPSYPLFAVAINSRKRFFFKLLSSSPLLFFSPSNLINPEAAIGIANFIGTLTLKQYEIGSEFVTEQVKSEIAKKS